MTSALSNLATIVPFNCVESGTIKCKRTYDYVKTDSKFYRIGANGKNEVADSTDTSFFNFGNFFFFFIFFIKKIIFN